MTAKDRGTGDVPNSVRTWRGVTERTVQGLQAIPSEAAADPTVKVRLAALAALIVDLVGQEAVDAHEAKVYAGIAEPQEGEGEPPSVLVLHPKAEGQ